MRDEAQRAPLLLRLIPHPSSLIPSHASPSRGCSSVAPRCESGTLRRTTQGTVRPWTMMLKGKGGVSGHRSFPRFGNRGAIIYDVPFSPFFSFRLFSFRPAPWPAPPGTRRRRAGGRSGACRSASAGLAAVELTPRPPWPPRTRPRRSSRREVSRVRPEGREDAREVKVREAETGFRSRSLNLLQSFADLRPPCVFALLRPQASPSRGCSSVAPRSESGTLRRTTQGTVRPWTMMLKGEGGGASGRRSFPRFGNREEVIHDVPFSLSLFSLLLYSVFFNYDCHIRRLGSRLR